MASKRRGTVEGVIVGGVIGLLSGIGFAGIKAVCIAVASTSESSELCGEGEYGKERLLGLGLERRRWTGSCAEDDWVYHVPVPVVWRIGDAMRAYGFKFQ